MHPLRCSPYALLSVSAEHRARFAHICRRQPCSMRDTRTMDLAGGRRTSIEARNSA
jgi:hypothetical protein